MQNLDSGLLCLELGSIALGYKALNAIAESGEGRILEAGPAGSRFLLLALAPPRSLHDAVNGFHAALEGGGAAAFIDHEVLENVDPRLTEALYSLPQVELGECLIVVETQTICGLLQAARALIAEDGIAAIELKVLRSSTGGGYGFFTGPTALGAAGAERARSLLRESARDGRIEIIGSPSAVFRSFFNLSGS